MKVAILSESEADEAAYRILANAVLGVETRPVDLRPRSRGWSSVVSILPAVIKQLHYRTDAEGLVVVGDSNHSPIHTPDHKPEVAAKEGCRLCWLRRTADEALASCRPVAGRPPLRLAVGLAIPAIEAWLLCGRNSGASEAAWINGLREGREPYSKRDLKQQAGTERASVAISRERMTVHARRLAEDIGALERAFPVGFGVLARELRTWRTT